MIGSIIQGMVIDMNETRLCSLEQLQAFVEATAQAQFLPSEGEDARYAHIEAVLKRLGYRRLGRKHKGLALRYLVRTTGYSRQQVTRLVRQFRETRAIAKHYRPPAQGFARTYTAADVALLAAFPFTLLGFHADNGSEYINHQVARLLEKLRVEFTKSRPRHSNDNGLAETKNGAVVRKCFSYSTSRNASPPGSMPSAPST